MERKFKIGDRVTATTMIVGEIVYINPVDVEKPYLVQWYDGSNMFFEEKILDLHPPKKLPEPKYNVGDKVKARIEGLEPFDLKIDSWCIAGNRYFYTLESQGYKIAGAYSVEETEPKYKKGDKVWDKGSNGVWEFEEYLKLGRCIISYDGDKCASKLSDIEPYRGQDKAKEETQKERNTRLAAELIDEVTRLHPELKQVRSGKFLYNPNRKNVFSIDIVKEFKFTSPPYIWIETWDGTQFSIEDTDGKKKKG